MKALIFDLDGTLVDSVCAHTLAWQRALAEVGIEAPTWEIQSRIGMSGKLLARAIAGRRNRGLDDSVIEKIDARHTVFFHEICPNPAPLPGARELIAFLETSGIAYGIATSGKRPEIDLSLQALRIGPDAIVVDGTAVERAKPEPDLFLACQARLDVERSQCIIVGDAVWDIHAARRAGILAVALRSGGAGEQDLYNAGAMRVYADPAELHGSLDDLAIEY